MNDTALCTSSSRYIKEKKYCNRRALENVGIFFLFSLFVMPQYCGIPTPVFDFTVLRIALLLLLLVILSEPKSVKEFGMILFRSKAICMLIPYFIVLIYTMLFRADINALLNPFFEIFQFALCMYLFLDVLDTKRVFHILVCFLYTLAILGILEYLLGTTPFYYLKTIDGIYTGRFVRSGHYRIMSSCSHSLGYGLLLIVSCPIACYDAEKKEISLIKHFPLLVLLIINIFLTGSRSTLVCMIIEMFLMFCMLSKEKMKRVFLVAFVMLIVASVFLILFRHTEIARYILLQMTTLLDQLLGTTYSVQYGANMEALGSSANYRAQLKYIYQVDWLNPLLGIGRRRTFASEINGSFIKSIDDFYVAEYVRYAYPGLFSFVFFLGYHMVKMAIGSFRYQSGLCRVLLVGMGSYLLNLHWVDSLQTLKYLYILIALYYMWEIRELPTLKEKKENQDSCVKNGGKNTPSRYIRRKQI